MRSRMAAARGSVPRTSRFSSSVSVIVRSRRISSISVESKRLPALSGATSGWSYRMIGDDSTTSRSPSSPASTGNVPMFSHPSTAAFANSGGSMLDTKAPSLTARRVWTAASERRTTSSRGASGSLHAVVFSTRTRTRTSGYGPSSHSDVTRTTPFTGSRVRTSRATGSAPSAVTDLRLAAGVEGEWERPLPPPAGVERVEHDVAEVELLLDGLVPGRVPAAVDLDRFDPAEVAVPGTDLDGARLHLEAAELDIEGRVVAGLDDALGLHRPRLGAGGLAVVPRSEHPELPADLVLGGRRPVRVQDVALVQHRVTDRAGPFERSVEVARDGHPSSPASLSSVSSAWSHVGRARRPLKAWRRSSVSRRTRIQPPLGK